MMIGSTSALSFFGVQPGRVQRLHHRAELALAEVRDGELRSWRGLHFAGGDLTRFADVHAANAINRAANGAEVVMRIGHRLNTDWTPITSSADQTVHLATDDLLIGA